MSVVTFLFVVFKNKNLMLMVDELVQFSQIKWPFD